MGQSCAELPPSAGLQARTARHLLQLTFSQGTLHSPADRITVPLAAALRSKHKRATMLQLRQRQRHGRARGRGRGMDGNLMNIKRYQLQKKKERSK